MRSLVAASIVGAFVSLFAALARFGSDPARAQTSTVTSSCKSVPGGRCCDPSVAAHLPRDAIFSTCRDSLAIFVGEEAGKDTCRYLFRVDGQPATEATIEVSATAQKRVPVAPADAQFRYKRIGKAFVTDRALSAKAAPRLSSSTGLWLPGAGYVVDVSASTKVCTRSEAERLAESLR